MKPEEDISTFLKKALPSPEQTESACEQVLERLRSESVSGLDIHNDDVFSGPRNTSWIPAAAIVAAGIVFLLVSVAVLRDFRSGADRTLAVVEGRIGGPIQSDQIVRSKDRAMVLALTEGSRIEMRPNSKLTLQRAVDGIRIRLGSGGVIVSAAKQQADRHLYVLTKDVIVSVVGTVFLVNAEEEGSRVAVIQGEVRVQQGASVKRLLPGEQVATGSSLEALPVAQEISWSRSAAVHMALLQQGTSAAAERAKTAAPTHLEFAAVSIKPHSGLSTNGVEPIGFVCHGIDGSRRAAVEFVGSAGPISAPQGRCVGNGVQLQALVAFAYGIPDRDVSGVPDWAVPPTRVGTLGPPANAFQIDAVAEDTSSATADQLRQMVQAMLADRFKLRIHRETKGTTGYALIVAKNGPKPKLKETSDAEEIPTLEFSNGLPTLRGKSTMDRLAQWLSGRIGAGSTIGAPVVDKTGLTRAYDYEFVPVGRGGGGGRGGPGQVGQPGPPTPADRAANISALLEDQLGLRLENEKAIPVDVVVIDRAEKPSEN